MIDVHRSKIHKYPVIYFFKGLERSPKNVVFKFRESIDLFSSENLGSNLVELAGTQQEVSRFFSKAGRALISDCVAPSLKKVTLVDLSVSRETMVDDFLVEYQQGLISTFTPDAVEDLFTDHLGIKASVKKVDRVSDLFEPINEAECHYLKIVVSNSFIERGRDKLSDKYKSMFADRYKDSQVPFIALTPCLAGMAEKR